MSETSSNAIPAYLPLRNDLIGEEPYGAPQLDVPVCLNVNENPYAPEPAVVETIAQRVKEIAPTLNRYPDREHIELRKAFSTYLERESGVKLSVDQLWGANGSNEIMLQLFQAFGGPGRIALGCDPNVLHVSGIRARHVPRGSLRTATPTSRLTWTPPSRRSKRSSRP